MADDGLQISARKNLLEIELNEGLVRRREELRLKIEGLGASEAGDANSEEALEAKQRELKALNNSIDSLQKKIQGELAVCMLPWVTVVDRYVQKRRRT